MVRTGGQGCKGGYNVSQVHVLDIVSRTILTALQNIPGIAHVHVYFQETCLKLISKYGSTEFFV